MSRCRIIWQIFCKNSLRKSRSKAGCYALSSLKNSHICTKIWLSAPKIAKTRKLQHYFPIIVNICTYHGDKNRQKEENIMFLILSIYIRDLNLAPIRFVQFVPRIFPRCPLCSFIIFLCLAANVLDLAAMLKTSQTVVSRSIAPNFAHCRL